MKYILFLFLFCLSNIIKAQTSEKLYQDALASNNAEQIYKIGVELYSRQDYHKAVACYEKAVKMGHAPSMYDLSCCYLYAKGVPQNDHKAFELVEQAYNNKLYGYYAQNQLGYLYSTGRGCKQDFEKARKYYEEAIGMGSNYGYYGIALMYAKGEGTKPDFDKALLYIDEAIKREWNVDRCAQFLSGKGEIYSIFGKKEEVFRIWHELVDKYPDYLANEAIQLFDTSENDFISYIFKELYGFSSQDIPRSNTNNVVLIIGNENYKNVQNVPYAINDSFEFYLNCKYRLGINDEQIQYCHDASLGQLRKCLNWLKQEMTALEGKAKVMVYYAGHGIPDEKNQTAFLLPVDGIGANSRTGYSLNRLYSELSSLPAEQITVLLDACFSGTKRDGDPLVAARGIAIKAKEEKAQGNMVVLSAAQGDETAYPYTEKRHGLFTYYLLNKLQESKGNATLGELSNYIIANVKKTSIINNGKLQTPTVNTSLDESWKKLTLK